MVVDSRTGPEKHGWASGLSWMIWWVPLAACPPVLLSEGTGSKLPVPGVWPFI